MSWIFLFIQIASANGNLSCNSNYIPSVASQVSSLLPTIVSDFPWMRDPGVIAYTQSDKAKKMLIYATNNRAAVGAQNSLGKCNLYVVKAVAHAGLPAWTGATAYYAYQVKDEAKKLGYRNLLEEFPEITERTAPVGAILVYSSEAKPNGCKDPKTNLGCGHIEIKTDLGYVSDYFDRRPVSDSTRTKFKLTAVLVPKA
ncbi:hypothetical protein K2P97_09040 [bacterium]|nr:hypothetical protein [bacterium]